MALTPNHFLREGLQYGTFIRETNARIGVERYNSIKRGIALKSHSIQNLKHAPNWDPIVRLMDSSKKGSRIFRMLLAHSPKILIPHNIVKFSETTDCVIGKKTSDSLNKLWVYNFLDNATRTFLFKLHNNTLGVNARVSKFIRGHTDMCTFCMINQIEDENKEGVSHLFFSCMTVENLVLNTLGRYLGVEERELVSRGTFFGSFGFEEENKNTTLQIISAWIKKYIWDCKIKGILPTAEQCYSTVKDRIKTTFENSKVFREMVGTSGLNIRF